MDVKPGRRIMGFAVAATLAATGAAAAPAADATSAGGCQLGNGVKHVVNLVFDNVHFFRDNPRR